jgi:UDP-2,3-diacylglucosamine hydrolase
MQSQLTSTAQAQPDSVALFISDLHLAPSRPKTTQAFFDFMRVRAMHTQQLYLLGDLFEGWIGDDDLALPWNQTIADAIRSVSNAGIKVFWIGGNRDVLISQKFAAAAGMAILPDLHVTHLAGKRIALAHGDAQCTNDHAYIAFRAKTHNPIRQKLFLALPLALRRMIMARWRNKSNSKKQSKPDYMMDVSQPTIDALFDKTGVTVMIHGHTHRPARHDSDDGKRSRYVLPDWDCESKPERGGWVALYADGTLRRLDIQGRMVTTYPAQKIPNTR